METPDFYFASREHEDLAQPRKGFRIRRIGIGSRNDGWVIRLDPPLRGVEYGGDRDVQSIVVATRHQGASIWHATSWPIYVYVLVPTVDDWLSRDHLERREFENVAWAELYRTEDGARSKVLSE